MIVAPPNGLYQGIRQGAPPFIIRSTFCNEAKDLIARATMDLPTALKIIIDRTIKDLKDAGLWDKIDVLYFLNANSSQFSCLNWKANQFNIITSGGPSFLDFTGWMGGPTAYLKTGWIPANSKLFTTTRGGFHFSIFQRPKNANPYIFGTSSSTTGKDYLQTIASSSERAYINANAYSQNMTAIWDHIYSYLINNSNNYSYDNGGSKQTTTYTKIGKSTNEMVLCGANLIGSYAGSYTGMKNWIATDLLTDSEVLMLNAIIANFNNTFESTFLGPELNTDPYFSNDSLWTKGTGWSIANNTATYVTGVTSNIVLNTPPPGANVVGQRYRIMARPTANLENVYIDTTGGYTGTFSLNETTRIVTCASASEYFGIRASLSGNVTSFSIKQILPIN